MDPRYIGALLILVAAGNSGCVFAARSHTTVTGNDVTRELFDAVVDGETKKDWILENLGPPTVTVDRGDGMEDLKYESSQRIEERASILLLLDVRSCVDRTETCVFELKNNVVLKHYRVSKDHRLSSNEN